ncbi:MAG: NADH-quinone oxidoreductase subunit NuoE [Armatimonadota bacterium]|nr:NADH-quinone oxidoreductase subunit NuoE [Armatimonadota bacterium]MCX7777074.1 NADH-quinone oxidoreductase subunit NuoE [Armatimonadota bacterium]MDW8024856.1 NADH-quinone oxidoreductase subunit NuoE [Armatimonadota bacterium]
MVKEAFDIDALIERHGRERSSLIPLLQEIQSELGYVPKEAIKAVARELDIFEVEVYEVLTFYAQFRLTPRGKHVIKVCLGTACHVMGGQDIFNYVSQVLGVSAGETTKDGTFTLERVACLGCCGMAPVVAIDDQVHGRQTISKVEKLLREHAANDVGKGEHVTKDAK